MRSGPHDVRKPIPYEVMAIQEALTRLPNWYLISPEFSRLLAEELAKDGWRLIRHDDDADF